MFTQTQGLILVILLVTMAMFAWGRWRHDIVALGTLLVCVLTGLVPGGGAFAGFGHPAVITVACVLVLSAGLQSSGAIDAVARWLPHSAGASVMMVSLIGLAAILSAFMNNVGALALLMPIAIHVADRQGMPPGRVLMPLSFGSILGGMTTLVGTPPNIIVAGFRQETAGDGFAMFDFTPVGLAVAAVGIAFIVSVGWRLVPPRQRAGAEGFETGAYLTEARVRDRSGAVGLTLRELEGSMEEADAQVIGLIRGEMRIPAPSPFREIRAGDILLIQAEPNALASALSAFDLRLEEDVRQQTVDEPLSESTEAPTHGQRRRDGDETRPARPLQSKEIALSEFVILPSSDLVGHSASDVRLRSRFGINLLAVSRQGRHTMERLRDTVVQTGDVLLLQGSPDALADFAAQFGCAPLAERAVHIPDKRRALTGVGIMIAAVAAAALDLAPVAIAFATGALAFAVLNIVSLRSIYKVIDWPVIILLGALIPVAGAMTATGAADVIARLLLEVVARGDTVIALGVILVVSMTLSDFMNNAATAALMCPIAISTAERLAASPDPFLMSVAIGASCAFLTPIGHQNNTLILGPGGFRFSDYWRLGLPLEIIVVAVGIPMILMVWPLSG